MNTIKDEIICPIWRTLATEFVSTDVHELNSGIVIVSPRAGGKYSIAEGAATTVVNLGDSKKILLTSWLVEQRLLDVPCPIICDTTMEMVAKRQQMEVFERTDNLLRYLEFKAKKNSGYGGVVKFNESDNNKAPETMHELLAWTASRQLSEVIGFAEYCSEQEWIKHSKNPARSTNDVVHELKLLPPGYNRIGK